MTDRRIQEWEEKIDGSTLEQRRDQRKEQLAEFLWNVKKEGDPNGVLGMVNQYTKATGVSMVPQAQSVYDLDAKQKQLKNLESTHVFNEADLPPIVKRTPDERINAMVARLKTASPETLEPMLQQIAGEYWKAGSPVTVDALRAVAAHFLNRTERRH